MAQVGDRGPLRLAEAVWHRLQGGRQGVKAAVHSCQRKCVTEFEVVVGSGVMISFKELTQDRGPIMSTRDERELVLPLTTMLGS